MATMIIPVIATIATVMIFQIRFKVKKSFTGIWWQEVLSKWTNAYKKTVHWKRNLVMLPSGAAGKRYVEEVTRLMELWIQDTPLKPISLKAVHAMPELLLKSKQIIKSQRSSPST